MLNKQKPDSFQAFLVEGASFTTQEEYPVIEHWMVPSTPPKKILTFEESLKCKNPAECFVCFYAFDDTFERVRRHPRRYLKYFEKFAGIIGTDFSVHSDQPLVKQKSQMNDNLALSYYFGRNGIPIIPNIRYGSDCTKDEFLSAIPKNSLVAIGTHGFVRTRAERMIWISSIHELIAAIHPLGIVVYGTMPEPMNSEFSGLVPLYLYDTWAEAREKEMKHVGD